MSAEDHWGVTSDNAYTQVPPLLPRIRTVLWLIVMEIEGHHSQRNTHLYLSLSTLPSTSCYLNESCYRKEQSTNRLCYYILLLSVSSLNTEP